MRSPFPGMDPYLEAPGVFADFHAGLIAKICEHLVPILRPRYSVRKERRIYVESSEYAGVLVADVAISRERGRETVPRVGAVATGAAVPIELALPVETRETYLEIRDPATRRVITVLEVLSPTNKRHGADGHREYMAKRRRVLGSGTHLIEIDLLRSGSRPRDRLPVPPCDYYAMVSRSERRPHAEAYCWSLREPMPVIPVPLARPDLDVGLDVQAVFDATYQAADYSYTLAYGRPCDPPLTRGDASWARRRLPSRSRRKN